MTFKVIRVMQDLSNAIRLTFVQHLARFLLTRLVERSLGDHWRSQDFWLGGPVNFHHWLRLPWTILVTVRVANNRHWKYGTHKTERKREVWRAEGATIKAPRGGEGLCPSPENFSNFCLEIACYRPSAFWKQFFRLDSSLFTDQIVTLTQR